MITTITMITVMTVIMIVVVRAVIVHEVVTVVKRRGLPLGRHSTIKDCLREPKQKGVAGRTTRISA